MSFERKVFEDHIQLLDKEFNVDLYQQFIDPEKYIELYNLGNSIKKLPKYKRVALVFGPKDSEYTTEYSGKKSIRTAIDWDQYPLLKEIGEKISKVTGVIPNRCIFQWYPTGKIGIATHRDKEIGEGKKIAGVSFGSTRTLLFNKLGIGSIKCELVSGSLYVMNPPTNQEWTHSIIVSDTEEGRISLTYREY